ncbi:MAG: hypothetical protein NTZ97_04720, partial [Candidatus Moranbacteria bacterium]|nr:hypothetical protein [Candidatus Moranbacteria bacterium]
QRERKNYPDKRFDVGFNDKNWYLYLPPIVNDYGFSLSFRIAPRLFKGLVVNPERKLNRQEIKDGIEKIEKIYEEYLRRVREDKKFRERTDLEHNAKIYEEVKNGLIHYGKTEELDTEKRKEFAEKVALKMIGINKGKPKNLVPLYDLDGNLLWPKQMSYEEVKKFVAERDKNKINDQKE